VLDGTKVTIIAKDMPVGISGSDHRARMGLTLKLLGSFFE